jgi:hypothetical protein
MTPSGKGSIDFGRHVVTPLTEVPGGPAIERIELTSTYHGAIEGESHQLLLVYYADSDRRGQGQGIWIGLEQVRGRIGDRDGTFVIQQQGQFDNSEKAERSCEGTWQVVADSGTGGLIGLRGGGSMNTFDATGQGTYTLEGDFDVERR